MQNMPKGLQESEGAEMIRYIRLRMQGFTAQAANAMTPERGDSTVVVVAFAVLAWLLVDSFTGWFQ